MNSSFHCLPPTQKKEKGLRSLAKLFHSLYRILPIGFYSYWETGKRILSPQNHVIWGQKEAHWKGVTVSSGKGHWGLWAMFPDLRGQQGMALWGSQGLGQCVHCAHGAVLGADLLGQSPFLLQCAGLLIWWRDRGLCGWSILVLWTIL